MFIILEIQEQGHFQKIEYNNLVSLFPRGVSIIYPKETIPRKFVNNKRFPSFCLEKKKIKINKRAWQVNQLIEYKDLPIIIIIYDS